jgi:6-pyruvoyltetrahydropterin/6-carboxytetrahydropterin synthase
MTAKKYTIQVQAIFEAAHNLRQYHGAPEPIHGHTWKVEVFLTRGGLDHEGMAVDFLEVKAALDPLIQPFDHRFINEIPPFDKISPSTENIAAWIFDELNKKFVSSPCKLQKVTLWEGPNYSASVEAS